MDFRHFLFQQTFEEHRRCTAKDNLRIVVAVVYASHNGTYSFTLAIEVRRNLFCLREKQFIAFIIEQEDFLLPNLINFGSDDSAYLIDILVIQTILFQFQDLGSQCLAKIQDSTTTELSENHLIGYFFTYFVRRINLTCFRQRNLSVIVFQLLIFHHHTVTIDFKIPLVRVYNHVVILIGAKHFRNHTTERFFEHTHHGSAVNVLSILKFRKCINQTDCFFFLGHNYLKLIKYLVYFISLYV